MLGNVLAFGGRESYLLLVLFREVLVLYPQYHAVIEICVLPALLYGAENWILNPVLVDRLESFQGELAKRILCITQTLRPPWSTLCEE